jgi:small conductance mechanosensitive channel
MDLTLTPTHLDRLAEVAWSWAAAFLPRLVAAVLILLIGTIVARWVSRAVYDISRRTAHIDPTLRPVLASMIRYAVLILVLIVALTQIGIQTASLLAVVGAAGLAIGLALQVRSALRRRTDAAVAAAVPDWRFHRSRCHRGNSA